jgi:hypothetical protein
METDPSNSARCHDWSPRQIWLSVRKLVETAAATSYPGSKYWRKLIRIYPPYRGYRKAADRVIPLVVCDR